MVEPLEYDSAIGVKAVESALLRCDPLEDRPYAAFQEAAFNYLNAVTPYLLSRLIHEVDRQEHGRDVQ